MVSYRQSDFVPPDRTVKVVSFTGNIPILANQVMTTGATHVEVTSKGAVFRQYQGPSKAMVEEMRAACPPGTKFLASWRPNECRAWMPGDGYASQEWLLRRSDHALETALADWQEAGWTWGASPNHWPGATQEERDRTMFAWGFLYKSRQWLAACPEFYVDPGRRRLEVTSLRLDLSIEDARNAAVEHGADTVEQTGLDGLIVTHNPGYDSLDISFSVPENPTAGLQQGQWIRIALDEADVPSIRYYDPAKSWGPEGFLPTAPAGVHGPIHDVGVKLGVYEVGVSQLILDLAERLPGASLVTNAPFSWRGGEWWGFDSFAKGKLEGDSVWVR